MVDKIQMKQMLYEAIRELSKRDIGDNNPVVFTMDRILPMADKMDNKYFRLVITFEEKQV